MIFASFLIGFVAGFIVGYVFRSSIKSLSEWK